MNSATDLGILIDDRLSYNRHINSIVLKLLNVLASYFVAFYVEVYFLKKAFVTHIRPVVEYCSVVWSPCFKSISI